MATGDLALAAGLAVFPPTQDLREGYNNDNIRGDEIATAMAQVATPGADIVLLLGQSNMSGRGSTYGGLLDPINPRIFQARGKGANRDQIIAATEPLDMHDDATGIGPGLVFARWYAARRLAFNRTLLLVPAAHGGTPLSSSDALGWRSTVAGNLYANAISRANAALTAAGDGAKIVAVLWLQGETDGDNGTTYATYQPDLDALISGLRAALYEPTLPFILGTMVPEYIGAGTRAQINGAHVSTPKRVAYTDVALGAVGMNKGDGNHYNGPGNRANGRAFYDAFERVAEGLAPYALDYTPPSGIVLGVAGAFQAYSLRRVAPDYAGPAVQVQRATDASTTDIGFTGAGVIDQAALLTFASGGSLTVRTWYDQTGGGRHVTQTVGSYQPLIVASGVVVTSGGKPAVTFDGVDDLLFRETAGIFTAGRATMLAVLKAATPAAQKFWWAESVAASAAGQYGLSQPNSTAALGKARPVIPGIPGASTNPEFTGSAASFDGTIHQLSATDSGAVISQHRDGVADLPATAYTRSASTAPDRFTLGGQTRLGSSAPLAMTFSELIIYTATLSVADRQTVEASQKAFYTTP